MFSGGAGTWPNVGGNSNTVPVVANGKVYVASYEQLSIFGLGAGPAAAVTANPSDAIRASAVQIALPAGQHEISGTVVAAGAGFPELLGRHVVVPAVLPCGDCELCKAGRDNICQRQTMPGNDFNGGFASHLVVPARVPIVQITGGTRDQVKPGVSVFMIVAPAAGGGLSAGAVAIGEGGKAPPM